MVVSTSRRHFSRKPGDEPGGEDKTVSFKDFIPRVRGVCRRSQLHWSVGILAMNDVSSTLSTVHWTQFPSRNRLPNKPHAKDLKFPGSTRAFQSVWYSKYLDVGQNMNCWNDLEIDVVIFVDSFLWTLVNTFACQSKLLFLDSDAVHSTSQSNVWYLKSYF